jgi:small subunit ribosomal protein S20
MPHTSSAKKSLRQTEKRRLRNRAVKKELKLQIKKVQAAAKSGTPDVLRTEVNTANKKLDRAASKRVIHRNQASRKKSQLARLLKTPAAAAPKTR